MDIMLLEGLTKGSLVNLEVITEDEKKLPDVFIL